jgi:hypothetical protein
VSNRFDKPVPLTKQGARDYPSVPEPFQDVNALAASVQALKRGYETLVGYNGRPGARAVRLEELDDVFTELAGDPDDPTGPTGGTGMTEAQVMARVSVGV